MTDVRGQMTDVRELRTEERSWKAERKEPSAWREGGGVLWPILKMTELVGELNFRLKIRYHNLIFWPHQGLYERFPQDLL